MLQAKASSFPRTIPRGRQDLSHTSHTESTTHVNASMAICSQYIYDRLQFHQNIREKHNNMITKTVPNANGILHVSPSGSLSTSTAQKSQYPPGNHHAIHL